MSDVSQGLIIVGLLTALSAGLGAIFERDAAVRTPLGLLAAAGAGIAAFWAVL